ncbi:MAG: hypothetical protein GY822_02430 [Deltaproteobacteria bacterium]|nr:hypothetical protein [Deltaproteobacteria bacterium]
MDATLNMNQKAAPRRRKTLFGIAFFAVGLSALPMGCEAQSDFCERYVECEIYYEEELALPEENMNRFRPDGVCWESADLADGCNTECRDGLLENQAELAIRNLDVESCAISASEAGLSDDGGVL